MAPLTVIDETTAFGLILSVRDEADLPETFLIVNVALTAMLRSVSDCGNVTEMSYFWTVHVWIARGSSCEKAAAGIASNTANKNIALLI